MIAGIVSTVLLASFVGGWIWAWRPARRAAFDAAARLPLDEALQEDLHANEREQVR